MGRKSKRQLAKEEYKKYETEWLKTHDENTVNKKYATKVILHCREELQIEDTSNYFIASLLAGALYSKNEGTDFYKGDLLRLYEVMPKDKVDTYVYGKFENDDDRMAANFKYNELEYVNKYRFK